MSRAVAFAVFFAIALCLMGTLHYYAWARLIRDLALPAIAHYALSGLMVALFLSIPATFWLLRGRSVDSHRFFAMTAFVWMGVLFLLVSLLFVTDIGRLFASLASQLLADLPPADPERRLVLSRMLGAGVVVTAGGASAVAARSGLTQLVVRRVRVPLERLPPELSGITIVQLSDLHVGPTLGRDFVERVVELTNALEPDVVAITGDLVDGPVSRLRDQVAPLERLEAKHGVYFVTGNHEYYSGAPAWCREIERLGIRVLRNERVSIGSAEASFDLAGVDDFSARQFGHGHGANLGRALDGRDPSRELVLLAHQPRQIHEAERMGVGLQLSGHTHGGQIFPWNFFVRLQQPVVSGLERIGRSLIYVSNGTGFWGPPMRLGAPAEITEIELVRA